MNEVRIRSRQRQDARVHTLHAFGRFAGHHDGCAKTRRLLLHTARIGYRDIGTLEQMSKRHILKRFGQNDIWQLAEAGNQVGAHLGIWMHGNHDERIRSRLGDARQSVGDAIDAVSPILAPMGGRHNDWPLMGIDAMKSWVGPFDGLFGRPQDRVDAGISSDIRGHHIDALINQSLLTSRSGR